MTTSLTIPTSRDALRQHDSNPVPWVTRWDGEVSSDAAQLQRFTDGRMRILYADGRENRESSGILWIREGVGRNGAPQYSQVNTYRQRSSMSRGLCQVCGTQIPQRPIRWLMDRRQLEILDDGTALTISPPTCSSCVPLALDLCPNFKRSGYYVVSVLEYRIWGVMGEFAARGKDGEVRLISEVRVPYDQPNLHSQVVAKQQVAQLTKFKIVEEKTP